MSVHWISNLDDSVLSYIEKLEKKDSFNYKPALNDLTKYGEKLSLGFSTFGIKLKYIFGVWENYTDIQKIESINFINSFQQDDNQFPKNSYIDPYLVASYSEKNIKNIGKEYTKKILSLTPKFDFESNEAKLLKAINAETKQAISTLHQVGAMNTHKVESIIPDELTIQKYLDNFDWSMPWNAGAQFASLCVYSETQNLNLNKDLLSFIKGKSDKNTGSYFSSPPSSSREVINGAMKVISGLDWLKEEIHNPKELIDYCLSHKPILEGCDIVDYIYVLFKTSQQVNYRKKEINEIFYTQINELKSLFVEREGGFSYFKEKSQTHYYGVQITNGKNQADIHGTTLAMWALSMITNNIEDDRVNLELNLIKP